MSDDPAFRCPVCRASQVLSDTCRRCRADLNLVARAYRRLDYLKRERDAARSRGDHEGEQLFFEELQWFAPSKGLSNHRLA